MKGSSVLLFVVCFLAVFLISSPASAQVLYGSFVGTVEDQSGAGVPDAVVTATNPATNQSYTDKTDSGGRFDITNVLPGTYSLKVVATGFRTLVQNEVNVTINTVTRQDLKLQVGQVSEQVTVEAQAVQLQTDKSDVHTEINAQAIENLPLTRYRNYQQLINLTPGTTPASFQNSSTDTPG